MQKYNEDWIYELKAGDKVVVRNQFISRIATVTRVTPKQIVIGGSRFWKKDRCLVGGGWHWACLDELTPERKAQIEDQEARNAMLKQLDRMSWKVLSTSELKQVIDIINEWRLRQ